MAIEHADFEGVERLALVLGMFNKAEEFCFLGNPLLLPENSLCFDTSRDLSQLRSFLTSTQYVMMPNLGYSPILSLEITFLNFTVAGILLLIILRSVKHFSFIRS